MAEQIPASLMPQADYEASGASMPTQLGDAPIVAPQGVTTGNELSLYDHKNNTIVAIPHDEAEAYLKTGQYTLPKKTSINIVGRDGEAASIDGSEAYNALQSGYRLETQEEQRARKVQEQYGGLGEGAVGALEAFSRGASLGASDVALTQSGDATAEALAGRQEANPISSTIAEGAGLILSPVNKILPGAAIERTLTKQALKAGLSNSVAKAVVNKILPAAAGSAVEGAFYGAGQLLSEDALGKADLNAENLAAYIGTGALLNGAFGMAFSTAGQLVDPVSKVAKFAASPFTSKISSTLDSKISSGRLLGLTPIQLQKLEARNPKVVQGMEDYLKQDLKLGLTDTAEQLAQKNQAIKETAGQQIGSVLKEVDEALILRPDLRPSSASVWDEVYRKVYTQVEGLLEKDAPGMGKHQKVINDFLDDVGRLGKADKEFNASDLQRFKKSLDKMLKYEKEPGKWTVLEDMAFSARNAVRDEIDLIADNLYKQGVSGDLSSRLKAANRQYSSSATFGNFLEKRAAKAGDKSFGISQAARDTANDLSRKLVVLGKIEQGRQFMNKAVKNTVEGFKTSARGVQLASQVAVPSIVASALAVDFSGDKAKRAQSKEQAYNNVLNNLNSFSQSPVAFMDKANRQTSSLYGAAPQTSAQLDNLAMTAMSYLAMKAPKRAANPTLLSSFKPTPLPSSQELAKFARILAAVEKPQNVLKSLQNGTASREEVEVLKEVYPATFQQLQETFINELPKLQKTMDYNRRVQLGILMGTPADASMLPANVLGLQSMFAQQGSPNEQQGAVKQTVGGMQELNNTGPEATPMQQVQTGEQG